ncbi:MAG: hypothetical protein ACM3ZE_05590 [Myxococcales bacterium]
MEIRLQSDATRLKSEVPCILAHVPSDTLIWGLGFSEAIGARWPQTFQSIQLRLRNLRPLPALGEVLWTSVESGIDLAHLVVERSYNMPPVGLDVRALQASLSIVAERALAINAAIHRPALGHWTVVWILVGGASCHAGGVSRPRHFGSGPLPRESTTAMTWRLTRVNQYFGKRRFSFAGSAMRCWTHQVPMS